ncbi:DUF2087 domain-containing protein [Rhodobacter ferrooxidans]|uniref:DUF2087 domain-containing protein n=1 Tax=Rhodobacter ferrooxidans TaxID=371731 RepID=C8S2D7_9RHOB|nr:DUF2087 domain-containing protein [Rhodobacter sp. SW2]EEW24808.1 conserved hypothetical protein [Rhodobacter sp. SW2]
MTRTLHPFQVDDLSALTRSLHQQLQHAETLPGHLGLMNMLARGAGFRNLQHLQASARAGDRLATPAPASADMTRVAQVLRYFDGQGRLQSWPARTSQQQLALWALWARLPPRESMTERQISARLNDLHCFGDAAILRRTLWQMKLISRTEDCRDYRRIEQRPTPEAAALIRHLNSG